MSTLLSVKNCIAAYDKKWIIQDVSLDIEPGTSIGLIGPNGAGKTTLLLSISGQFQPKGGRVLFHGDDIYEKNYHYKKLIGYVHESPFFYDFLTAREFLFFVARLNGMDRNIVGGKCDDLLAAVRLAEEKDKLTVQLSQGMRKKLAIAAALIHSPEIVFLDEALNGIDVESAFYIKNLLIDYVKNGGTVVLSTHVLEVIEKMCDRYIIIKNGKIIADLHAQAFAMTKQANLEQHVLALLRD